MVMAQRIEVKQTNKFILGLKLEFSITVRWDNGIRPAGFHPENPSPVAPLVSEHRNVH